MFHIVGPQPSCPRATFSIYSDSYEQYGQPFRTVDTNDFLRIKAILEMSLMLILKLDSGALNFL